MSMGKAALKSHMEGTRHQRCIRDSATSVPIAKSFASVEEISQVAPTTFTNESVMEGQGTGESRAVQSLSDLSTLSKKSRRCRNFVGFEMCLLILLWKFKHWSK